MVTGKKGKKSGKGKTVSLNDFLAKENNNAGDVTQTVVVPKSSWADEVDDYEAPRASEKIVLPSAPRASLGPNISDDRIPKEPPFTAYLANLSYDINPEDVYDFFGKLKINNVRLLRDGDQETGRLKGYGYADFGDRESLIEALSMNDQLLKNRKLRIDISTNAGSGGDRGNRGDRFNNRNDNRYNNRDDDGEDRTQGDWRSGPAPAFRDDDRDRRDRYDPPRDRGGFGDRGGYDNDRRDNRGYGFGGDRGYDRRDNRGGGGFDRDRRDGGGFDRDRRDGGGYDRDRRDGGGYDRDRRDGGGYDRDRRDGGGYNRRDGGGYDRRDDRGGYDRRDDRGGGYNRDRRSAERDGDDTPKERPRLQLQKRTAPVEPAPASASSAIFGGAKPVDTAKKEREIEEKLQKQQEDVKSRSRTQSERSERSGDENNKSNEEEKSPQPHPEPPKKSSIFGDAKPVDTTKKEREIEAKLKTIEVNDDVKKERPRSGGSNIHPENSNDNNHGTGTVHDNNVKGDKRNVRSPTTIKKVEEKPPNFIETSKFAALPVEDDVGSGKEDSD